MKRKSSRLKFISDPGTTLDLPQWINEYPKFNYQVKAIRESMGISQEKLAENIGLTWRSIPNIESGNVNPKITTLQKIADYLNCDLKILLIPRVKLPMNKNKHESMKKKEDTPQQKKLSFNRKTDNNNISQTEEYAIEKKKEYFWD